MKTLWCLLCVIICLLKYSHSFLSIDTGKQRNEDSQQADLCTNLCQPSNSMQDFASILGVPGNSQELRNFMEANETTFELCQNVLRQVVSRLTNSEAFFEVLREKGNRVNEWIFGKNTINGKNWCIDKHSPIVYISWNHKAETCMNLRVFDKTEKRNTMKHICEEYTSPSRIYAKTESIKTRSKRELEIKNTYGFVNIAKEWKGKSCSKPLLEVYINKELLFSNATSGGQAGEENAPKEQIKVYVNANLTSYQPKPKKKYTFVHNAVSFATAKQDCFEKGMRLLTVKNADESTDIVEAMKKEAHDIYWTSGNKLANKITWRWSDSEKFKYVSWANGQPNNEQGNEHCVEIWRTGDWNDNACEIELPYICEVLEIPKDGMMPTMEIFVDKKLVFENTSKSGSDMAPTVSVHIGLDANNNSDHSTIVLFKSKDSSKESAEAKENLVIPKGFIPDNFNGIDFIVEMIREKDFSCPKTYHITPENIELNYSEALKFCQNRSMELVSIQDGKEMMEVEKELNKTNIDHYFWTSGYLNDGVWYWNKNEKIVYNLWAPGEPSDSKGEKEKCIELYFPYYNVRWNNQECSDKNRVICESLD